MPPVRLQLDVQCPWPFRLGGGTADGLLRRRGPGLQRLYRREGRVVHVGALDLGRSRVRFAACGETEEDAAWAVGRLRFALGVDDDLAPFHERFRDDPVIGRAIRAVPHHRVKRREPWEALAWAITEQLIEYERAVQIQRRMIAVLGSRCPVTGLRLAPDARTVAATAPARLCSFDLNPKLTSTLRRAAEEVAHGRVDLASPEREVQEHGWRRLRAIRGIGPWTIECLALFGQGRYDQIPAGDLGYLKLVGRLVTGNPKARVEPEQVYEFFAPYGEWAGLAGEYTRIAAARGLLPLRTPMPARQVAVVRSVPDRALAA